LAAGNYYLCLHSKVWLSILKIKTFIYIILYLHYFKFFIVHVKTWNLSFLYISIKAIKKICER
jgi:hypothetical protein